MKEILYDLGFRIPARLHTEDDYNNYTMLLTKPF